MTTTVDGIIGVVTTGNVTANNFFGNIDGNSITGDINITGNVTTTANISGYNVAAANQVYVGPLQLRAINPTTFGVFQADGVTQANIDVGNVDASQITQGTSKVAFDAVNGNAYVAVNGSNVMEVTQTGLFISSEAPTGLTITSAASESSVSRIIAKSSRGTLAAPTPISQNDQIVSLTGYAYTSFGNYQQTGGFGITANGPAVPNGTSLVNSIATITSTDSSGIIYEMRLDDNGNVVIPGRVSTHVYSNTAVTASMIGSRARGTDDGNIAIVQVGDSVLDYVSYAYTGNGATTVDNVPGYTYSGGLEFDVAALPAVSGYNIPTNATLTTIGAGNTRNYFTFANTGDFTVPGNMLVNGNITATGNINIISGNAGQFFGNLVTGANALYAGIPTGYSIASNAILQLSGNLNDYMQLNAQNINSGPAASFDYVITADNGTDTTNFIDMGIVSSTWDGTQTNSLGNALNPDDGYLYVNSGNLVIGADAAGTAVKVLVGTPDATGIVAVFNASNLEMTGDIIPTSDNTYSLGNSTNQWKDLWVSGNTIYVQQVPLTMVGSGPSSNLQVNGSNVLTVSAGGTTTLANLSMSGNLIANGDITSNANIYADNNMIANGNIRANGNVVVGIGIVANANITANANVNANGMYANFTITAGANINAGGNITAGGNLSVVGNGSFGNLSTSGNLVASGDITGNDVNAFGNVNATGNVSGANMTASGNIVASGNLTGNEVNAFGNVNATGNVSGNNMTASGNIVASGNLTGNDVNAFGNVNATGNVSGANVTTSGNVVASGTVTGGNFATIGNVVATGNVSGGNVITGGVVQATGTITGGNLTTSGNISGNNLSISSNATITGNTATGGILTDNYYYANGAPVDFQQPAGSNTQVQYNLNGDFGATSAFVFDDVANVLTIGGNIDTGNIAISGLASSDTLTVTANAAVGNISTAQLLATDVANVDSLIVVNAANIGGTGNVVGDFAAGANIDLEGNLNITGNISQVTAQTARIFGDAVTGIQALRAGVITGFANLATSVIQASTNDNDYSQINQQNVNNGAQASADYVITANDGDDTNFFLDLGLAGSGWDGTQLNSLGNAVSPHDGYLYINQGNLVMGTETAGTAVKMIVGAGDATGIVATFNDPGTISSTTGTGALVLVGGLGVSGNINSANLTTGDITAGNATVSGTVTAGNISTGGSIAVTGNISGGNLTTSGQVVAIGNVVSSANVNGVDFNASNSIIATANITSGNLITSGVVLATGNISGANISATGQVIATGNLVSSANINGVNLNLSGLAAIVGNVAAGNVTTAGQVAATGNVSGGNLTTAGQVAATGNITSGGNIDGVSFNASDLITAVGNITGGNIDTAGQVVATGNLVSSANVNGVNFNASGNAVITGNVSASGSATITGNVSGANINTAGQVVATGDIVSSANVYALNITASGNAAITGNVSGGNISTAGTVSATGNVSGANVSATGQVIATGNLVSSANVNGVNFNASGNAVVTGNIAGANLTTAGQVIATGNVVSSANVNAVNLNLSGLAAVTGNLSAANLNTGGQVVATGDITTSANVYALNITASGNIAAGNVSATTFTGNLVGNVSGTFTAPGANTDMLFNDAGVIGATTALVVDKTSSTVTASGNIIAGNVYANSGTIGASLLTGTLTTVAQPNVTSLGTLNQLTVSNATANIIQLGPLKLKSINSTTFGVYQNDGVTQANIDVSTIDVTAITQGTTIIGIDGVNGNGYITVAGSNVFLANATGTYTTGISNATGNINGANLNTAGVVVATGNITGGNINTGAQVVATGNITGGNINTAGAVVATGNIAGANANIAVNVTAGNLVSNFLKSNGLDLTIAPSVTNKNILMVPTGTGNVDVATRFITSLADPVNNQDAATKNYVDQFVQGVGVKSSVVVATTTGLPAYSYNNGTAGVGATITALAVGVLTIDGVATALGNRVLVKNEVAGLSIVNGIYTVTTAGAAGAAYVLTRSVDMDAPGEIPGAFTFVQSGSTNASTGWVCTSNAPVVIGTTAITWSQFSGAGAYTAGPGISLVGSQFSANIDGTTTAIVGGNIAVKTGAVLINPNITDATGTSLTLTGGNGAFTGTSLTITGNALAGNVYANSGTVGATTLIGSLATAAQPNITSVGTLASLNVIGNVAAGNVSGTLLTGTITTNAQPNITSVGTLSSLTVTGNTTSGNVYANSGTIGASLLTGTLTTAAQPNVTSIGSLTSLTVVGAIAGGTVTGTTLTGSLTTAAQPNITSIGTLATLAVTGNASVGNISVGNLVSAPFVGGTLTTAAQPNITSVGTLTTLTVSGNVTADNFSGILLTGTLTTAAQPNVTSVGTLSSLTVTGNVAAGNVSGTLLGGTLTTAAQPNVTSVGTLTSLDVTGNITGANIYANSGTIGATTVVGTLATASQPNITTIGTLGNLTVTSNISVGNVNAGNFVGATYLQGTLTGGSAAQPNITSIGTLATLTVSGNASVGNLSTLGALTAVGNLAGGNISTGGLIVATGNISGANLNTAGVVAASGNVVSGANVNGVNFNSTGNIVVGGNSSVTGNSAVTGNISGANISSGNLIVAGGNIQSTAGYFIGDGGFLSNITVAGGTSIVNGTSNVTIPTLNGNIGFNVAGASAGKITATSTSLGVGAGGAGTFSTAIGSGAGGTGQGSQGVAIGYNAGASGQGSAAVAIGALAGQSSQVAGSIAINASGSALNPTGAGFFVNPVRSDASNIATPVFYNSATNEFTYSTAMALAGNITAGNVYANAGTIGAGTLTGTLSTAAQTNITSVGTLTSLNVTGVTNTGSLTTTTITAGSSGTAGTITGTWSLGAGSTLQATYSDLGERYSTDVVYEPGTLLMIGGTAETTLATKEGKFALAGIVSTEPAYVLNADLKDSAIIALAGRVPCKVVGKINKGDILTISDIPGVATVALVPEYGTIIARALESYDSTEVGVIEVKVDRG